MFGGFYMAQPFFAQGTSLGTASNFVLVTKTIIYNVDQIVPLSSRVIYNVSQIVANSTRQIIYNVNQSASANSVQILYDVLSLANALSASIQIIYNVGATFPPIPRSQEIRFDVLNKKPYIITVVVSGSPCPLSTISYILSG